MQAHPDGVELAAGQSQSVAPGISIDASHDLEIGRCTSRLRLRLLVAAGFAITLLSASLAFDWWGDVSAYDTAMGYAGVAVFGPLTGWLIWMLPSARGAVVIVTAYGIRDLRIGNEFVLWDSIADVSAEESRGRKAIVLTPTPALQRQLACIRASSRGAQADRIVIRSEGLATDFDTLLRACRDCHAAADSRTALRRDSGPHVQSLAAQAS